MTWSERRRITILSTILLILVAAVLIVLGIRYRESRAPQVEGTAVDPAASTVKKQTEYTALSYKTEQFTLSFSRDSLGTWRWDGNEDFPLDDTIVKEILGQLTAWKPQQTLTDAEALESSGVANATRTLTAVTETGGLTTLDFGRATTDGNSYYVRLNGDETTVYIIADTLYKLMDTPVFDMCRLPQLPALTEAAISSIAISSIAEEDGQMAPFTVLSAQQAEDGSSTTWRSNGANVTDDPSVKALLADLAQLAITKCVLFDPSEEAVSICGFDTPAAALTVVYTANGMEQSFCITIGERLPDGSGRYIRLDESSTIYFLPTELLDPLMRLSNEGLEG